VILSALTSVGYIGYYIVSVYLYTWHTGTKKSGYVSTERKGDGGAEDFSITDIIAEPRAGGAARRARVEKGRYKG